MCGFRNSIFFIKLLSGPLAYATSAMVNQALLKPGSHERHKHKNKMNTKTKHDFSSGTCEDKTTRIFLCFAFCSALGLCLDYGLMLMLMTILMSQA